MKNIKKIVAKILIVDDEPDITEILENAMKNFFTDIITASNGVDALLIHEKLKADVIISDIKMPRLDGFSFLKILRERADPTPFIIITGHGDLELACNALRLGVFDFISKPFDTEEITLRTKEAYKMSNLLKTADKEVFNFIKNCEELQENRENVSQKIFDSLRALQLMKALNKSIKS